MNTNAQTIDPVNAFLAQNRPSAQDEDKALIEALIAKIGARLDKTQSMTFKGLPCDPQRFIVELARDLREIDALRKQWSGEPPMPPDVLHGTVLDHVRGIDKWKDDKWLLEQHAAAVRSEEPKLALAYQQMEHLKGAVARSEIGCLHAETPETARRRTVAAALANLGQQQSRTLPLGTTQTRAAAMRPVIDIGGRNTVVDAIAPNMPVVDRHSSLETEREALERKCNASHPQTREFDQLIAELAALKVKVNAALEAEATELQQKAAHLVGLAGAGDIDAMIELQRRTSGPMPGLSAEIKRARASEGALAATVGEIIRTHDENLSRQSPKK
jgi:hypothetical protein